MTIIELCGKAGVGKDTFGKELKKQLEEQRYKCVHIAFGDRLKDICTRYFNWNGEKDEYGRHLLQTLGTKTFRSFDEDYWVEEVASTLAVFAINEMFDYAIITDARFPNEIERFNELMEFYLTDTDVIVETNAFRIKRNNFKSQLTEEAQKHSSETALDDFCMPEIILSGKLENLPYEVGEFIKEWLLLIPTKKF